MKKTHIGGLITLSLLMVGFFVPIGSYTSQNNVCPDGNTPVVKLHAIKGETIQRVTDIDNQQLPPEAGCSKQIRYKLYFL